MDQNKALQLLAKNVDESKLTRQERDTLSLALQVLGEVSRRFSAMLVESEKARAVQKAKAPDPTLTSKTSVDNEDKSQA